MTDRIRNAVCKELEIDSDRLMSRRRDARTVLARQVCMYVMRRRTRLSYPEIGKAFGRHHGTAMYAEQMVEIWRERYQWINEIVERVEKDL